MFDSKALLLKLNHKIDVSLHDRGFQLQSSQLIAQLPPEVRRSSHASASGHSRSAASSGLWMRCTFLYLHDFSILVFIFIYLVHLFRATRSTCNQEKTEHTPFLFLEEENYFRVPVVNGERGGENKVHYTKCNLEFHIHVHV